MKNKAKLNYNTFIAVAALIISIVSLLFSFLQYKLSAEVASLNNRAYIGIEKIQNWELVKMNFL